MEIDLSDTRHEDAAAFAEDLQSLEGKVPTIEDRMNDRDAEGGGPATSQATGQPGGKEDLEDFIGLAGEGYEMICDLAAQANDADELRASPEEKEIVGKYGGRILQRRFGDLGFLQEYGDEVYLAAYLAKTWSGKMNRADLD